jgi:hypothetical protein
MGYKLRREVRAALPPGLLTAAERLLVLELADLCGDETREGWPGAAKLATLTDLSERSIQEAMSRIGRKWIELRVPLNMKNGKPVFAYTGRRTTYRFPPLAPHKGATDPGADGATDPGPSEPTGAMDPGERCDGSVKEVRQIRGPFPLGTSLKINHSSLSPREDEPPSAATVPAPRTEREIELTSSSEPKGEESNPIHRLLLDAGCPEDQLDDVRDWITAGNGVNGFGWWVTVHGKGHLAAIHVPEALKALGERKAGSGGKPPWCGHCDERTRQRTTEWMENVSISRCPECHPLVVRDDKQPRTEERDPSFRPSRAAAAARQGLAVADRLDRENGHGIYAPRQIRSPADQILANAEPLHRKYKAQETGHKTFSNPPDDAEWGV